MAFEHDQAIETYKSMISIGTEALKALQLINGGAIVALLAYLGQASNGHELAKHVSVPLSFFVAGLLLGTVAFLWTYFTQFALLNEFFDGDASRVPKHQFWLGLTVCFAFLSIVAFAIGSFTAVTALSRS
jgi:hypothetical protein